MAKRRRDTKIWRAMRRALAEVRYSDPNKWKKIKLKHKTSIYFTNNAAAGSFAAVLNKRQPMKDDGVKVKPYHIANAVVVAQIYAALLKAYQRENWEIIQ